MALIRDTRDCLLYNNDKHVTRGRDSIIGTSRPAVPFKETIALGRTYTIDTASKWEGSSTENSKNGCRNQKSGSFLKTRFSVELFESWIVQLTL